MEIRPVKKEDLDGLRVVLDSSKLFPSEYLDDIVEDYLENPHTEDIWFTLVDDQKPVGIGYCALEEMTEGTFNLIAIAVHKEFQGKGAGTKMMQYIEQLLQERSARILIVETSSGSEYELTRKFYENLGYEKEASIRDFWNEGEDKVICWKKLIG